jgi:hypothetical protein
MHTVRMVLKHVPQQSIMADACSREKEALTQALVRSQY